MLWLALLLPALPLQLAERALPCIGPLAIVEGPPQRLVVIHCNAAAQAAGVAPGMKLAAAQALARELIALERNAEREQAALAELAGWAYQFSSHVVLQPDGLLLEVGGSVRLFGGRAPLHRATAERARCARLPRHIRVCRRAAHRTRIGSFGSGVRDGCAVARAPEPVGSGARPSGGRAGARRSRATRLLPWPSPAGGGR